MSSFSPPLIRTTLARKAVVAVSGFVLVAFLVFHLWGNGLLLSADPQAYNRLAHDLETWGWGFHFLECLLAAAFLVHTGLALETVWRNRAVGGRYAGRPALTLKRLAGRSMAWTGPILLAFLGWHLVTLRFGPGLAQGYSALVDGERVRDLSRLVAETLQRPAVVGGYGLGLVAVGLHLGHGISSGLQTLGLGHPTWTPRLAQWSLGLAGLVVAGYGLLVAALALGA